MRDNWSLVVFDSLGEILGEFNVHPVPGPNFPLTNFVVRIKVIPGNYIRSGQAVGFEIFIGDMLYATRKYAGEIVTIGQCEDGELDLFEKDLVVFKQSKICSCGCWTTYGKNSTIHADWCDVK